MTRLKISIDGVTAFAELKDTSARGVEKVSGALPLSVRLTHATRSGSCAIVAHDSLRDANIAIENQVSMYYPGMLAYDPVRGYLVLAYGQGQARSQTGVHWVSYLGDVTEGADALAAKLQDTRDRGASDITIEREG